MEDHHVDRLGVEVQQCTKLTSTNRSIGLIAFIVNAHLFQVRYRPLAYLSAFEFALPRSALLEGNGWCAYHASRSLSVIASTEDQICTALCWPGDFGGAPTPDPIPNSAVKGSSADGTKS